MSLDPASGRRSVSPESSGRDSPIPRQWRNQLGGGEPQIKDKAYRRYASGVDKSLSLFETALEEWADYISFLNRLLKALQSRPSSITVIPAKVTIAKRLSQCLNPSLPSGVHQKTLEVYAYIFSVIGKDGLSRDLPLYLPGLAPTLSFASLSVRSPHLDLLEKYFLCLDPRCLRPAMKSIVLALLPGLEDETSEDFERTLQLVSKFKEVIRPEDSGLLTDDHSSGDAFFWQCFFLASITSQSRRSGALAYLVRYLPVLGSITQPGANKPSGSSSEKDDGVTTHLANIVTTPEPGLLIRCFAAGLSDEQLLIQRGFLDLLVTHVPLDCAVLQKKAKSSDIELLFKAAIGVVIRRDMSLNRRLWTWLLGPETTSGDGDQAGESGPTMSPQHADFASRTSFFEEYGLQPLIRALLMMVRGNPRSSASELARPYRICLSLMDRWEIGGLVVPEVFLPIVESVQQFKERAFNPSEFSEVLRSASMFFDGIESGLIYGELVSLLAQAIGPGSLAPSERSEKLSLINFVLTNFNVREEEMITIHAPLTCLAALFMLEDANSRRNSTPASSTWTPELADQLLKIITSLLELIPERAFLKSSHTNISLNAKTYTSLDVLKKIRSFYVDEQGNIDGPSIPFTPAECGHLILGKSVDLVCDFPVGTSWMGSLSSRMRILVLMFRKAPSTFPLDVSRLLKYLHDMLDASESLPFSYFSSVVNLSTQLHGAERLTLAELSTLVVPLVQQAWVYLSTPEPKYHVEAVRGLWQLQTVLSRSNRDIEAALSGIIVKQRDHSKQSGSSSSLVDTFGVLWSHTLQDNPSDRRGSKTSLVEQRGPPRLAGMDHFDIMLTQPLFLILDALMDDGTLFYMNVKIWLRSTIGIDRLFLILVSRFSSMTLLQDAQNDYSSGEKPQTSVYNISKEDDVELCLYYLQVLYRLLYYSGDTAMPVLATKHLSFNATQVQISTGGDEQEITLQQYFVRICMRCIMAEVALDSSADHLWQASELCRIALTLLHCFCSSQYSAPLSPLNLENALIERLASSLERNQYNIQPLLLDVIYDTLRLREEAPVEPPAVSPTTEKRRPSLEPSRNSRPSVSMSELQVPIPAPPPQLLKCLQDGLSSRTSRVVLDHWVAFLGHCLPFYARSIFQILIPLVETLCKHVGQTFTELKETFSAESDIYNSQSGASESSLIYLLNGLEHILAQAHDQLLAEEARSQLVKSPDQTQSIFGSMVSGVFQSDAPQSRSATANDRLTVHLAFQDAVRMCYDIWCWGQGDNATRQDNSSLASFTYTSLRLRNRARRLLEHLFTAETLECLETIVDIWRVSPDTSSRTQVFKFLASLDASRPRQSMPALFNSIYSRTNPSALEPSRKSTMTISLSDVNLVVFLVAYAQSLDDDAMDEIWQDCMIFLKDLLGNPFPHRQTLPSLLEFAAILGVKVDNTNFGEQRKMRRELGDLFLRLLAALFTTRPITFTESTGTNGHSERINRNDQHKRGSPSVSNSHPDDVVYILSTVAPNLPKILLESDRVLSAAATISTNVIAPTIRSKAFPDTVSSSTRKLLHELARLPNNQKAWKKDVADAFNDGRFFSMNFNLARDDWLPLLKQWTMTDKEKLPEIISRISTPSTAGIVFGVGATSARLEADRKTQLNLRRVASLILSSPEDTFVTDLPVVFEKLEELLAATPTSSPSSTTRADVYMLVRAMVLKTSAIHLASLWPVVNAEIHAAVSSVVAPDQSAASETYSNPSILQACKLLDLLICAAPDDFQLHEWLFITDTIDAVYRSSSAQPIALVDELSEELGNAGLQSAQDTESVTNMVASRNQRRPLLGPGGINEPVSLERKDELVAKVLRPFFAQLSIFAFESIYAMCAVDRQYCVDGLLEDLFDDRTIVRSL